MAASKRHPGLRRERGAVIVEMAIALPLMLLIVAGVVDLGFLFWEKEVLTNAAREGARAGVQGKISGSSVVALYSETDVRTRMQTYLTKMNIKDASGSPISLSTSNSTFTWNTSATPPQLTVQLQNIPVRLMMLPNLNTLFSGGPVSSIIYLTAKCTMAREW